MKILECVISSGTNLLRVGLKIVSQVCVDGRALGVLDAVNIKGNKDGHKWILDKIMGMTASLCHGGKMLISLDQNNLLKEMTTEVGYCFQ
jgi:hypothetical protein